MVGPAGNCAATLGDRRSGGRSPTMPGVEHPEVVVYTQIPAPIESVWLEAAKVDEHVEWMADAHQLDFMSDQREGVGTKIEVETRFGPLRTTDEMEFVEWEPPHRMAVVHRGLFQGMGAFEFATAGPNDTSMTWRERIEFPWYFGGLIGAWVARPVLRWVWRRNLRRFRDRFLG